MTIAEVREKCKGFLARIPRDSLILGILLASSSASFILGYLAGQEGGQGSRGQVEGVVVAPDPAPPASPGQVVASRNGTKYYLPECAGAKRISDANKVWFASALAASAAGYAPAANCSGL